MGIDFTAIIGHHFTAGDLARLPEPLAVIDESLRALDAYCDIAPEPWQPMFPPEDSELGTQFREKLHLYAQRGGIGVKIGHRSMEVHHVCRWHQFAGNPRMASLLRAVCNDLARWAGSDLAVYLPDTFVVGAFDVVMEGLSIDEALRLLQEKAGPPAATIPETIIVSPDGRPWRYGYFVDWFEDLHQGALAG